jgi:hypothetical protein
VPALIVSDVALGFEYIAGPRDPPLGLRREQGLEPVEAAAPAAMH